MKKIVLAFVTAFLTWAQVASAPLVVNGHALSINGSTNLFTAAITGTDYSFSTTVSGAAKSAAAGFIAPLGFDTGTGMQLARVLPVTSTGTIYFYVWRVLGETGSISMTITLAASINTVSGTNFTPLTTSVTFADGERGYKRVALNVLAIPTGFGIVSVGMTGTNAYRPYAYLLLEGTGHVSGAHYLKSLGAGVDSTGNTTGSGTSGSPWRSPTYAATQIGSSCGVLYMQDSGGNFEELNTGTGAFKFRNACTVSNPLVVISDPDNSGPATIDNGETSNLSNAVGIDYEDNASGIWIVGLHVTHGNISFANEQDTPNNYSVVFNTEIDNYKINGSNAAGLRYDGTVGLVADLVYSHNIYSSESSHNSNEYDAVPSGFEECFQAFSATAASIVRAKADLCEFGVMQKDPAADVSPGLPTSTEILGGLFLRFQRGTGVQGSPIAYEVAGNDGRAVHNALIAFNVHEGNAETAATKSGVMVNLNTSDTTDSTEPSDYVDIVNNTSRAGGGLMGTRAFIHIRAFNNIQDQAFSHMMDVLGSGTSALTQLEYSNNNIWVSSGTPSWDTQANTYTGFASWKAVTGDIYVVNPPDANSVSTTTTPTYGNTSTHDYRYSNTIGQGSQPAGMGLFLTAQ